jgi:hypothetical protein
MVLDGVSLEGPHAVSAEETGAEATGSTSYRQE